MDTQETGKALLKNGQLKRRVTILPLNKIASRTISNAKIRNAENLVGRENVSLALNLVGYDQELAPVCQLRAALSSWMYIRVFILRTVWYKRYIITIVRTFLKNNAYELVSSKVGFVRALIIARAMLHNGHGSFPRMSFFST